ncbi:hypothetical protein QBZ16_004043 [Prototheca wickerhamii]|uniref:peptide-methionine (S)-S-oxide reductase n=1 Tax=Prototheca wickerhamii TaxID=3111 RepID=A0AAD9IJ67_PROWI|nr:hypothetical protein QBZ16_004043 [Prototheca wickerhamii]
MQVRTGTTGHTEAVQLIYDPAVITFEALVDAFLDRIYTHDAAQEKVARERLGAIEGCAVEIQEFQSFWPAEEYHQR